MRTLQQVVIACIAQDGDVQKPLVVDLIDFEKTSDVEEQIEDVIVSDHGTYLQLTSPFLKELSATWDLIVQGDLVGLCKYYKELGYALSDEKSMAASNYYDHYIKMLALEKAVLGYEDLPTDPEFNAYRQGLDKRFFDGQDHGVAMAHVDSGFDRLKTLEAVLLGTLERSALEVPELQALEIGLANFEKRAYEAGIADARLMNESDQRDVRAMSQIAAIVRTTEHA